MNILAHRGYWSKPEERNASDALRGALERGYGFESDIRDWDGGLVISHNMADGGCQPAEEVFRLLADYRDSFCFAINIKADGLKERLLEQLSTYHIQNYFTFDMSVPQLVEYAELGLSFFTRQSEIETAPVLYDQAAGVWLDGFFGEQWITEDLLRRHIDSGKRVCLVSPELHGRAYGDFWARILRYKIDFRHVLLCTDYPDAARQVFQTVLDEGEKSV